MLIRCKGYNTGAQEYLETGTKAGREFSRDELDERVILDGDLDLTRMVYESIPDNGQDRYLSFTMAFREDVVSHDTLVNVTAEFKQYLMYAYKDEEFNFYAEAHVPKIKQIRDKKTGEMVERKPHIHIIVPRKNLLNGNEANPVGMFSTNERFFEAFQEYVNQKYNLASPREHVRIDPKDAASVLSRYKGDDFYGKNREFKQNLVKQVIETGVTTRKDFYELVASHGEVKIRNQGKDNEYIAVKLPDDAKFTNLKDTIFQDDFIVRRELKKPPLPAHVIQQRLADWPQRAKELKYVSKATPSFRKLYKESSVTERAELLAQREQAFYAAYGESHVIEQRTLKRSDNHQRSVDEAGRKGVTPPTGSVQDMPLSNVADHRKTGQSGERDSAVLLPGDAHVHLGQQESGGDLGLRSSLREGGRGDTGGPGRRTSVSASAAGTSTGPGTATGGRRRSIRSRGIGDVIPPYARNPYRVATIDDIEERGKRLFEPLKLPGESELFIGLAAAVDPGGGASRDPPKTEPVPGATQQKRQGKRRSKFETSRSIPPFALNPHRVATISDIESRSQRLFGPLKGPTDSALVMKLVTLKPVAVNRSASTVAAYFNRQIEQNQLLPAERKAVRRVDKQFSEVRRSIFSDDRLTKQDKAQLVSVLTFERMKAREAIHKPQLYNEATYMGSAEIRGLVNNEPEVDMPEFSISGPGADSPVPTRDRVKSLISRLTLQVNDKVSRERERELSAKDIYTKKSRFSQNVHYINKTTDKTLFVDTGTSIAMRRNGITEAGVGVALQLATQRFGSTLTINGTAEFKRLVVEAAAKGGMDIHFTDKQMNEALTLRRAELDIEREGEQIQSPDTANREAADPGTVGTDSPAPAEKVEPAVVDRSVITGELIEHGPAPYKNDDKNEGSYFVSVQTEQGPRTLWGVGLQEVMEEKGFAQGDRITLKDGGTQPVLIQQPQADGSVKEVEGIRRVWSAEADIATPDVPAPVGDAQQKAGPEPLNFVHNGVAATLGLDQLKPQQAPQIEQPAAPAPLNFTHNGQAASLGLTSVPPAVTPGVEALLQTAVEPITIVHNGEPLKVDPANAGDVAKYTRELTNEVSVQSDQIAHATQRIGELVNMRDNHSAGRGPEYVDQCNVEIGKAERFVEVGTARLSQAETSLQKLAPAIAAISQEKAGPEPLNFVHNGQAAALGLTPVPPLATPSVEAPRKTAVEPVTIVHNGEPVTVDPANAGDVAKYTRELTNEVSVQTDHVVRVTQRIGELVNMRDNHSASRGTEYVAQCNVEIGQAERFLKGSQAILNNAETSLQKLAPAIAAVSQAQTRGEPSVDSVEVKKTLKAAPVVIETTEEHGPEIDFGDVDQDWVEAHYLDPVDGPEMDCSGLMKPDTHLGENARQIEVSDDQTTSFFFR